MVIVENSTYKCLCNEWIESTPIEFANLLIKLYEEGYTETFFDGYESCFGVFKLTKK